MTLGPDVRESATGGPPAGLASTGRGVGHGPLGALPGHRRDLPGRDLGHRPGRSHGVREPRDRADPPDPGRATCRADRLRHPRRGRPRAVPRAPGRRPRRSGQRAPRSRSSGCAATARSCGCCAARRALLDDDGPAAGAAAPLHRPHRAARADRVAAGQRGRARGPGRPEQPACRRSPARPTRPRSLGEVLVHARSLVLLHDDWERARAFVPGRDGSGRVEPFYPDRRATARPTPDDPLAADGARAGPARPRRARRGLGRAAAHHRLPDPARRARCTPSWRSPRLRRCAASS